MKDGIQPSWPDLIEKIKARTPARVLVERAGYAYRTPTQLERRRAMLSAPSLTWKTISAPNSLNSGSCLRCPRKPGPKTNTYCVPIWDDD